MREGPLDMRMSGQGVSAADAINHLEHNELIQIFKVYGEERRARRCADFIIRAREQRQCDNHACARRCYFQRAGPPR